MVVGVDAIHEIAPSLYHALVDEFAERLFPARHPEVEEELVPEARVDEVARGVLASAHIQVHILPVGISLFRHEARVVVRVHVAQVVGRRPGEARHGVEFKGEHRLVVHKALVHHLAPGLVPRPFPGAPERRFARLRGLVGVYFGQAQGQALLGHHLRHAVLVVHGERFAPVTLAREDGVAQAVVHLHASHSLFGDKLLCLGYCLLHGEAVEGEAVERLLAR